MNEQYDVVIVGTGIAGLYAALSFDHTTSILMISKKEFETCNSSLAQGGIAAVLDHQNDTFASHISDTLIAGKKENSLDAVNVLVKEGPDDVLRINLCGVEFDKSEDGELLKTLEGGHSKNRIVHHKDYTGKECVDKLYQVVSQRKNIHMIDETMLFNISKVKNGYHIGLLRKDKATQVASKFVILCTGGIGRMYKYTTNASIATGDGIALAYSLGAKIKNLNYIQFHPTAFAAVDGRERFLISEAVRGEGAILKNVNLEPFTYKYDKRGDLAPRDVVCSSIIKEEEAINSDNFYLDITHKDASYIKERFPSIYKNCLEEGIDITKQPIPVYPCQHYLMGGIEVDLYSRTNIEGLYACGECSHTGVHGRNRLASNSLLEALVFSRRAAMDISKKLYENNNLKVAPLNKLIDITGKELPTGMRTKIRDIMQKAHFVNINKDILQESLDEIKAIIKFLKSDKYEITNAYIETLSLAICAALVLKEDIENEA